MNGAAIARELRELAGLIHRQSRLVAAAAFLVAAVDVGRELTPALMVGVVYFAGPYGLLINGLDGLPEPTAERSRLRQAEVAALNLPFLVALVLFGGAAAGLALALTVTKAIAWGAQPFRFRDRPGLDVLSASLLVVLPAVVGGLTAGGGVGDLPWIAILALTAWAAATASMAALDGLTGEREAGEREAGTDSIATALGVVVTAMVAIIGFFLAAALAATVGPLGSFAAVALDLYLLLPAMVLTAPRDDPDAGARAVARATTDIRGLHLLVGAWLALLLAAHWGWVSIGPLEVTIVVSAAAAAWAFINVVLTRVATQRRSIAQPAWDDEIPSLTIIVPVIDDAERSADTIVALRDQTYADVTIMVVVDPAASAGSARILEGSVGHDGVVVTAPARPDGWVGSNWACQVGAEAASTDLLLFVEGETYLVPIAVRKLVEQLQRGGQDLLSASPATAMPTRSEQVIAPGFSLFRLGLVPRWVAAIARGRSPRTAYALPTLMLISREIYLEVGGHAASPGSHRPATALARTVTRVGRRVGAIHGADLGATREARTLGAAITGWRRTFLAGVGDSLALAVGALMLTVMAFVVPLALPVAAFLSAAEPRLIVASFAPLGILTAMRLALTLSQRQSPATILAHPLTVIILLVGQIAAVMDHVTGRAPAERAAPDGASLPSVS